MTDPRKNAPPCISILHGEERRKALIERDRLANERFMSTYRQPVGERGFFRRLFARRYGRVG